MRAAAQGHCYLKLDQYQQAVRDYDAHFRINAQAPVALYSRGVAKLKLGDRSGESMRPKLAPMIAEQMAEAGVAP